MCKYCEVKTDITTGEKTNDCTVIGGVESGFLIFELCLNRYILEKDDINISELILDIGINRSGGFEDVLSESVEIKYCPFCGEKL